MINMAQDRKMSQRNLTVGKLFKYSLLQLLLIKITTLQKKLPTKSVDWEVPLITLIGPLGVFAI